jgi:hypothetical protein
LALCASCTAPTSGDQGGAVLGNDRTSGGTAGEALLTGVMLVSPNGRYSLLQRNDVSVVLDVVSKKTMELPFQANRFVFAHGADVGYAWDGKGGLTAFDLSSMHELWRASPSTTDATLLSIADDDSALVVGGLDRASIVDGRSGALRGEIVLPSTPTHLAFLPGSQRAVIVGSTVWADHRPETALTIVGLSDLDVTRVAVPNCAAPIAIVPDGSRGFLSPTFCQEDRPSTETRDWTNPDPVSVVDFAAPNDAAPAAPHFVKNLPGFGPVALDPSGATAVAYLDTARMDPSMFDDKSQVPGSGADPYHLMVIDTRSLSFTLTPIGHSLPRFAMARDGKELLVDASVRVERASAEVKVTVDPGGVRLEASATFGSDAPFGTFDLASRQYTAFTGPVAALDRFVQTSDRKVFTLQATADGLGGNLFGIDLEQHATSNLGRSLRDVGILPDGETLLLRIRLPAVKRDDGFHRAEQICFSLDGVSCESTVGYESTAPIPGSTSTCSDYHDC